MTGFLGAGKTTVINQLLAIKPAAERWALLINEFGRIGIDGALLTSSLDNTAEKNNIAIREVSGGCICCTSQLPLQIAISRLLSEHHPQRLLIEPTGLAHPRELVRQLSAPHWQAALKMQAVITVLSALQWQQDKYRTHDGFQAHVRDADVLVINRYAQLDDGEKQALQQWIATLNSQANILWAPAVQTTPDDEHSLNIYLSALHTQLTKPSHTIAQQRTVNIAHPQKPTARLQPLNKSLAADSLASPTTTADDDTQTGTNLEQPYRYHEQQQDILLAGWRLPAHYVLKADELQNWLLQLPSWQRIKGVLHTTDGWLQLNFTPDSLTTSSASPQTDSRLEIILQFTADSQNQNTVIDNNQADSELSLSSVIDWEVCDRELMTLVV